MMKHSKIIYSLVLLLFASQAIPAEDWYWKSRIHSIRKDYSDAEQLDNLTGLGVYLSSDYLERASFTLGYNFNYVKYKTDPDSSRSIQEMYENILFFSASGYFHPDLLPGRLTLRLDGYAGNDEFNIRATTSGSGGGSTRIITEEDKFVVWNPVVSFLNYGKTFYADLGYAFSTYRSDDNLTDDIDVTQWTPTLGFGFNQAYDWLQIRAYLISLSSSNRVNGKESTSALEVKWTHWFSADKPLGLNYAGLSVVAGERIYAVDSDACSVCNSADLQKGAIAISAEWKLNDKLSLLLQGGHERYENLVLNDNYTSDYLYIHLSQDW